MFVARYHDPLHHLEDHVDQVPGAAVHGPATVPDEALHGLGSGVVDEPVEPVDWAVVEPVSPVGTFD